MRNASVASCSDMTRTVRHGGAGSAGHNSPGAMSKKSRTMSTRGTPSAPVTWYGPWNTNEMSVQP